MKVRSALCLILLFVLACTPLTALPARVMLSAHASTRDEPAQHQLTFHLESNAPLVSAHLLFGAEGGRTPLDVSLAPNALAADYRLTIPDGGLHLPRDLAELRYSWSLRSASGDTLTLTQAISSTQLVRDDATPLLIWREARQGNVSLYYLEDTPAARDRDWLQQVAADSVSHVEGVLDTPLGSRLSVYLLPRVFWQGGAAFGDKTLFISYADRPYTGVSFRDYVTHESAHALTQDWGNIGAAGGILAEGIAVYAAGGHYQPDLLDQSAAALAGSPLFIPLASLRRDFSSQQHEIAYTESGSFVKFLIEKYGLDKFRALVRRPNDWRAQYDKDFDALAQEWLASLQASAVQSPTASADVRRWQLKVRYYDLLRQYEERFDPAARRLPSVPIARWDGTLREALHAPADEEDNRVLELMLIAAIDAVETQRDAQLTLAEQVMDEVESKLKTTSVEEGARMREVRAIVRAVSAQDRALLERDVEGLRSTLDEAGHPQFATQFVRQALAQPAWLRFTQSPVRLVLDGQQAWLTVAQWAEPLDRTTVMATPNGQRWVLALAKDGGAWRVTGRWLDTLAPLMAR